MLAQIFNHYAACTDFSHYLLPAIVALIFSLLLLPFSMRWLRNQTKKALSLRPNPRTSRFLWTREILPQAAWALWVLLTPSSLCPQSHVTSHSSLIHAKYRHDFLVHPLCPICSRWKSDGSQQCLSDPPASERSHGPYLPRCSSSGTS